MGFCGESEADHLETLDLIQRVGYDQAFLFAYSERSQTHAARHLQVLTRLARVRHAVCFNLALLALCKEGRLLHLATCPINTTSTQKVRMLTTAALVQTSGKGLCPWPENRHVAQDDVDPATKLRRLQEAIALYKHVLTTRNEAEVSRCHLVLVEGRSRRDNATLTGKTCTGKRVFLPAGSVPPSLKPSSGQGEQVAIQAGDYLAVTITASTAACLTARADSKTTIAEFIEVHGSTAPVACTS